MNGRYGKRAECKYCHAEVWKHTCVCLHFCTKKGKHAECLHYRTESMEDACTESARKRTDCLHVRSESMENARSTAIPHMEARCVCTEQCKWGGGGPPRTPTSQGAVRLGLPPEPPPRQLHYFACTKKCNRGGTLRVHRLATKPIRLSPPLEAPPSVI